MPRKIYSPGIDPPGERETMPAVISAEPTQLTPHPKDHNLPCPNDDRITAIERHLEALENRPMPTISDEHDDQRIESVLRHFQTLREQVGGLKDQINALPQLSTDDVNNLTTALNERVAKMIDEKVDSATSQIRMEISSIKRASGSALAEDVERLSSIVTETGKLVVHQSQRAAEQEAELRGFRDELKGLHHEFLDRLSDTMIATAKDITKGALPHGSTV